MIGVSNPEYHVGIVVRPQTSRAGKRPERVSARSFAAECADNIPGGRSGPRSGGVEPDALVGTGAGIDRAREARPIAVQVNACHPGNRRQGGGARAGNGIGDVCIGTGRGVDIQCARAADVDRAGAQTIGGVGGNSAGIDRGAAGVGVGAGERQRAGAGFGEAQRAGAVLDGAGIADVCAEGAGGERVGAGRRDDPAAARERADGFAVVRQIKGAAIDGDGGIDAKGAGRSGGQRAGAERGGAGVGVGARKDQRAGGIVGDAAGARNHPRNRQAGAGRPRTRQADIERRVRPGVRGGQRISTEVERARPG